MRNVYGYILIAGASVTWGTMGILGKLAFEYGIDSTTLISLRLLISSTTILIPVALLKRNLLHVGRSHLPQIVVLGVFATALQRIAYFHAVDLTTVTVAVILFYTYPVLVTIYSSLYFKERITYLTIFSIFAAVLGVALVVRTYDISHLAFSLSGVAAGVLSSVLFALFFLVTKGLRKSYTSWTLILWGDGVGALALVPLVLISLSEILGYPMELWLLILAIAWLPSLIAYLMYSHALKYVRSTEGSTLGVLEPLSAASFSAIILAESFELLQVVGLISALVGVALLFYARTNH
ncbi:MAG: DMT family transporter [Candidatus Bathyarchaeota archaeon]|nr:MAG: DMT family transporter [Candidatus Bathyarchaeota archaeon]